MEDTGINNPKEFLDKFSVKNLSMNSSGELLINNQFFNDLLTTEDKEEILKYRNSLIKKDDNDKESGEIIELKENLKKVPYFRIKPNIWYNIFLENDPSLIKYIYSKNIKMKWVGYLGLVLDSESLKKVLFYIIKYKTGLKLKFNESEVNSKGDIFYDDIIFLSFNFNYKGSHFWEFDNINDIYTIKFFNIYSKYLKKYKLISDKKKQRLQKLEDKLLINNWKVKNKNKKRDQSIKFISHKDISKYFNWNCNDCQSYIDILSKFGVLWIGKPEIASDYIDEDYVEVLDTKKEDGTLDREIFINEKLVDKILSKWKVSQDKILEAKNYLLQLSR